MRNFVTFTILFVMDLWVWSAVAKTPFANPGVPDVEKITYGVRQDNGNLRTWTDTIRKVHRNGMTMYEWGNTIIIRGDDFRPISMRITDDNGRSQISTDYREKKAYVTIPGERIRTWIKVPEYVYDMFTLHYVLRGFPFQKKKKVKFPLLMPQPRVVKVSLELVGTETVIVPAGSFSCYKLKMGVSGIKGYLYRKRWYFWFAVEKPYHFVRYTAPTGESIELVNYDIGESTKSD